MAATLKIPTIFTAVDKFSSVVRTMSKSISKFTSKTGAAIKRFDQKLTGSFKKLNKFAQIGIGVGIGALFREAIRGNIAFDDSLASVSAITGAVGQDLIDLENLAKRSAKSQSKSGAEILKAYELVGSAKPELLKNSAALDAVTNSAITLSKASRLDLETSALSLTGVMNQFNKAGSESGNVIDALAAGAKFGAAQIPEISEAILKFGTGAKAFNVSLTESVALVEVFSLKGLKGAEAGTKLRNILSKMSAVKALPKKALDQLKKFGVNTAIVSDTTIPLQDRLKELSKIAGDSTALVKVFGLENKEAGQILLNNLPALEQMTKNVGENGVAATQAAANTNTFQFAIESIKNSFLNATTATNQNNKAMEIVKKVLFGVAENMDIVVISLASLIGGYVALKVVTGIMKAIQIMTYAWTAAQWLLNIALTANPIGIIIMAIVALVAIVALAIHKYDDWGASLLMMMGPLGMIVNLIQSFRRNWNMIQDAFKNGGIIAGLKAIHATIMDALLQPMEQFMGILSKLGIADKFFKSAQMKIALTRDASGVDTGGKNAFERVEPLPSPQTTSSSVTSEEIKKNNLSIDIKDKGGNVESVKKNGTTDIPINITNTQGAF